MTPGTVLPVYTHQVKATADFLNSPSVCLLPSACDSFIGTVPCGLRHRPHSQPACGDPDCCLDLRLSRACDTSVMHWTRSSNCSLLWPHSWPRFRLRLKRLRRHRLVRRGKPARLQSGVETMRLAVVAVVLPALLLLSWTPAYYCIPSDWSRRGHRRSHCTGYGANHATAKHDCKSNRARRTAWHVSGGLSLGR